MPKRRGPESPTFLGPPPAHRHTSPSMRPAEANAIVTLYLIQSER